MAPAALAAPRRALKAFWGWYQRNYLAVLVITTGVFLLQIAHLYWLFTDVVLERLTGRSYYGSGAVAHATEIVSLFADYLEVPTLVSASLLYVNELRRRFSWAALGYLVLLNTQWAHIVWITDEIVVQTFSGAGGIEWNAAVAWVAILIDFLELPVILDTLRRVWLERDEILARLAGRRDRASRAASPEQCAA